MEFDIIGCLEALCAAAGPSGREDAVREEIVRWIDGHAPYRVDSLGNLIVEKAGQARAKQRVMLDAHMDEVGFVVTGASEEGLLSFSLVGGMDRSVIIGKRVMVGNRIGVIGCVPVHLLEDDQRKALPKPDELFIDVGAQSREEALDAVSLGDTAVFDSRFVRFGDGRIKGRAIDDRAGCAVLIGMIRSELPFDMIFTFSVQEETGGAGAKTAAYAVRPDVAIVVEATTAADIAGVDKDRQVCRLGDGPAVSFMDLRTIYDRGLFELALSTAKEQDIPCQLKQAVAGGNNAGGIHTSREGVRSIALSLPCRYLHSPSCVISEQDLIDTLRLTRALACRVAAGEEHE